MKRGKKKCDQCGEEISGLAQALFYGDTCKSCHESEVTRCPCCKVIANIEAVKVGLVLTPLGSSPEQKATAPEVLVLVCPKCKVLFFDELTYKILEHVAKP